MVCIYKHSQTKFLGKTYVEVQVLIPEKRCLGFIYVGITIKKIVHRQIPQAKQRIILTISVQDGFLKPFSKLVLRIMLI